MVNPSTLRAPAFALLLSLPAASGCAQCSRTPDTTAPDGSSPAPVLPAPDLLPPPAPWTFALKRDRHGIALPEGCRLRTPTVHAAVAPTSRFVALPHLLATLVVADVAGDPPELAGVAALRFDPSGIAEKPVPLPWLDAREMPRLARTAEGTWLGAIGYRHVEELWSVALWRDGTTDLVGDGDRFQAIDLACSTRRCALLTTRHGKVAAPGADVWIGGATEPAGTWKHIEIVPSIASSNAYPVALVAMADMAPPDGGSLEPPSPDAGLADAPQGVIAALLEKGDLLFFWVDAPEGPREITRLPAPYGVLDAIASPHPIAMTYGTAPAAQEGACPPNDGKLRFERAGQPRHELSVHAAPVSGWLRKLTRGVLATFLAPLGCTVPRQVVYGVLLDAAGTPTGALMPIADAQSFAVATQGDEVDLWLQHEAMVTWVRATCASP